MKKTKKPSIPIGMGRFNVKPHPFVEPVVSEVNSDIHFVPITSAAFDGNGQNKFHIDELGQWESIR